jgi:hypothetical protein
VVALFTSTKAPHQARVLGCGELHCPLLLRSAVNFSSACCWYAPNYAEAYFWLTNGGIKAGEAFRTKVGNHLTEAQRTQVEKLAKAFHPSLFELLHDTMTKGSPQR